MTQKEKYSQTKIAYFAIFGGSLIDLSCIDFSMIGLKFYHINDPKLLDYFQNISVADFGKRNYEFVIKNAKYINENRQIDSEYLNVLVPISIEKSPELFIYSDALDALRLLHPSELSIRHVFESIIDNKRVYIGSFTTYEVSRLSDYNDLYKYYFKYAAKYISNTNAFLKIIFENIESLPYVKNALKYYNGAFRINDQEMAFVSLCICLECIVPTAEQLSFRFRRNLAVLCGNDEFCSKVIYENAKLLYTYRSKLVHFGMKTKDYKNFEKYFDYAMLLSSRMLIEMIIHKLPNMFVLDEKLNEIGFGDRSKISENYSAFDGNLLSEMGVLLPKLNEN